MTRTSRPLIAAGIAAAVVLSGCGSQIAGAPAGGPAVATGQSAGVSTLPPNMLTPKADPTVADPSPAPTGEHPADPTSTARTHSDPVPSPTGTTTDRQDPNSDPAVEEFIAMIARGMRGVSSYRGKISMDMGSAGSMAGTMQGTVSNGQAVNSEANIEVEAGSQSVEVKVVMIGTKVYLGGSTLLQAVPEAKGKTWILAATDSSNPTVRQLATSMGSVSTNNISSMIRFASAAKSVEKGGTKEIDGVPTTQYRVVLDPKKLTDTGTGGMTADSTEATFFVDGDSLMRRAVVEVGAMGTTVELTMDMTDYNTDVQIEAPDANTVYTG